MKAPNYTTSWKSSEKARDDALATAPPKMVEHPWLFEVLAPTTLTSPLKAVRASLVHSKITTHFEGRQQASWEL